MAKIIETGTGKVEQEFELETIAQKYGFIQNILMKKDINGENIGNRGAGYIGSHVVKALGKKVI